MYVTKRGSKYRAWERVVIDGTPKRISVTMDRDTPQSRKKAAEALERRRNALVKDVSALHYDELVEAYIRYQKATVKKSTWMRNKAMLEHLSKVFNNAPIDRMTSGYIEDCLLTKTSKPVTFNEYLKRIKALFRWAYRKDYISTADCVNKILPMKDVSEHEKVQNKFLEAEELKVVLNSASNYYASIYGFLALSGLRIGELIALDDSDVSNTEIVVKSTYDYRNDIVNTPKTQAGWRYVHVQPELLTYIKKIRKNSKLNRMVSGCRASYFVVNMYGGRLSYAVANRQFKRICKRLMLNKELSLHALRHTHVALMAENGATLQQIARRIGHSDSKITEEIYYHVTQKQREKDNATFDAISVFE